MFFSVKETAEKETYQIGSNKPTKIERKLRIYKKNYYNLYQYKILPNHLLYNSIKVMSRKFEKCLNHINLYAELCLIIEPCSINCDHSQNSVRKIKFEKIICAYSNVFF